MDIETRCAKLREHGLFGQAEYLKWHEAMRARFAQPGKPFRTSRRRNADGSVEYIPPDEYQDDATRWRKIIHKHRLAKLEALRGS